MINRILVVLFGLTALNCSSGSFGSKENVQSNDQAGPIVNQIPADADATPASDATPVEPVTKIILETVEGGLLNGHFDVDTAGEVYAFEDGETNGHVHEYDDKYGVNGVDAFDMKTDKLDSIQDLIASGQKVKFLVGNAQLSPLAQIQINGEAMKAVDFQSNLQAKNEYIFGEDLKSLQLTFPRDALLNNGLVATETSCVQKNLMGAKGEYRNGALIVQAVDSLNHSLDEGTGLAKTGLLWEVAVFWHKSDSCYKAED